MGRDRKLRGSPKHHVKEVFERAGMLQFGVSRHDAKQVASAAGAKGKSEYAQITGIHSHATYRKYFSHCTAFLKWGRSAHGILRPDALTSTHVEEYLTKKSYLSLQSFRQLCAAMTKFDSALGICYERSLHWSDLLAEFRSAAQAVCKDDPPARAYDNPEALVGQMDGDMRLIAELQWRSGLRVSEATLIRTDQLGGTYTDYTGRTVGRLHLTKERTKGGKSRDVIVPMDLYNRLSERLAASPLHVTEIDEYRRALKAAAVATGQDPTGKCSHGLRWNYAQERRDELILYLSDEQSQKVVTQELGHERLRMALHYQRRR
jgi:hypothetical protein